MYTCWDFGWLKFVDIHYFAPREGPARAGQCPAPPLHKKPMHMCILELIPNTTLYKRSTYGKHKYTYTAAITMVGFTYINGEEVRRLFRPQDDPGTSPIPINELMTYNSDKNITQLMFQARALPSPTPNQHTMVVHIDGACRNNGKPNARAAYGVYFGPGSPHNTQGLLAASLPQTSTRAEIEALGQALDVI